MKSRTRRWSMLARVGAATLVCLASQTGAAGASLADERIAFVSDRDGNGEIYLMDGNGSAPRRLTRHDAWDGQPTMPAVGHKIAFASDRDDSNLDIYTMNPDGTGLMKLTNSSGEFDADWSPAFSPDGSKIAFVRRQGNEDIYVMNADGSNPIRLTHSSQPDGTPTWSPDGKRIAFYRGNFNPDIYSMRADGTGVVQLTKTAEEYEFYPAWSPDGGRIAFVRRHFDYAHTTGTDDIFVMNADGSAQTQLTRDTPPPVPLVAGALDEAPAWSPDGTRIAFATTDPTDWEIDVMNGDGSGRRQLTDNLDLDFDPVFARAPSTARDRTPPRLDSLTVRPRQFCNHRSRTCPNPGARIHLTLSEKARLELEIVSARNSRRVLDTLRFSGRKGANSLAFAGRRLARGEYRLRGRAIDPAGNRSGRRAAPFRISRAR